MRLQDDGEVHRDLLPQALELVGFQCPEAAWVDEVLAEMTQYNTLDLNELFKFVKSYEARQLRAAADRFSQYDEDQSGSIAVSELAKVFESCGITPMDHVIREIVAEVSQDGRDSCAITLSEFRQVMDIIRTREGFSRREVRRFRQTFSKFDRTGMGIIHTRDLPFAMGWLCYAISAKDVEAIGREVDTGDSGELREHEFLVYLRKVHEREVKRVSRLVARFDYNLTGTIGFRDGLQDVLQCLGYVPDRVAISDAAEDAGLLPTGSRRGKNHRMTILLPTLSLSELWRLLEVFRGREGLTRNESLEVEEAFQRCDPNPMGEICTADAGKVLRWFGYHTTWELQQHLVSEVDVDGSGSLNLSEVLKLVRKYREREITRMTRVFNEFDVESHGLLTEEQCDRALKALNIDCPVEKSFDESRCSIASNEQSSSVDGLCRGNRRASFDVNMFVQMATRMHQKARAKFRENAGYTAFELQELQRVFAAYDTNGNGCVSHKELRNLLEDALPDIAHSAKMRPYLRKLLQDVSTDNAGNLDFHGFLQLMRQVHDHEEHERVAKEHLAVKEAGFNRREVEEFRELYMGGDIENSCRELTFAAFRRMIGTVCPVGERNTQTLTDIFNSTVLERDGTRTADFPEFLLLMRKLLDTDFGGLAERTQNAAGDLNSRNRSFSMFSSEPWGSYV